MGRNHRTSNIEHRVDNLNASHLNNDLGWIAADQAPVQDIVAGKGVSVTSSNGTYTIAADAQNSSGFVGSLNGLVGDISVVGSANISVQTLGQSIELSASIAQGNWSESNSSQPSYILNKPVNISAWVNDSGYITLAQAPVTSVNTKTGAIVLTATDVGALPASTKVPANTSDLVNNGNGTGGPYISAAGAPVQGIVAGSNVVISSTAGIYTISSTGGGGGGITQVQSDWGQTDGTSPSFILNKPTKVSTWVNDAGYITLAQVPANAVTSVNTKTGAVVLTAADVGALPSNTVIPTKVSTLTNDAGYINLSQVPADAVTSVNTKTGAVVLTAADVGALPSNTVIPTKVSTLTNDAGYINLSQVPASAVTSVNTKTGAVVLTAADVGALPTNTKVSALTNDAGYINLSQVPADAVTSVNGKVGVVVLAAADIGAMPDSTSIPKNTGDLVNNGNGTGGPYIDASGAPVQNIVAGSNVVISSNAGVYTISSTGGGGGGVTQVQSDWGQTDGTSPSFILNKPTKVSAWVNDSGYITLAQAPVASVNTKTGAVVLTAADVGALPSNTVIPTKVSALTNDAGYINLAQVPADAVTSVNTKTGAVVLTAADVGALPSNTVIPTKVSALTNDAGYINLSQVPADAVTSVNTKTGAVVLTAADVGALPSNTVIPTKVSALTNDAGYINLAQVPADAVTSVNTKTGAVVLTAADVGALPSNTVIPTKVSTLTNDAGYINLAQAPVTSVNTKTGAVVLTAADVGALPSNAVIPTHTSNLTNDGKGAGAAFVDALDLSSNLSNYLKLSGGTMTGDISWSEGPAIGAPGTTHAFSIYTNGLERVRVDINGYLNLFPDATRIVLGNAGSIRSLSAGIYGFYSGNVLDMTIEPTRINGYKPFNASVPDSGGAFVVPNPGASATRTGGYAFQCNVNSAAGETRYQLFLSGNAPSYIGGQFLFAGGSAAAPPISSSGMQTTGVYFPTTNVIGFSSLGTERLRITATGDIQAPAGYAPSTATSLATKAYVDGKVSATPPATSSATGAAGDLAYDAGFLYVCVGTNQWKRVALQTF